MKKLLALLLVAGGCSNDTTPPVQPPPAGKTTAKRAADCIGFTAPAAWIEEEPANNMRKAQFKVADREKKAGDALFVLSKLGPQPVEPNLQRWAGQMDCDVPKAEEIKGHHKFWLADLAGTYHSDSGDEVPNARMIVAMLETEGATWFFKLVGPAETVADYKDDFVAMVKGAKLGM